MSLQAFYRVCLLLPLAPPALVVFLVHGLGMPVPPEPLESLFQLLLGSLLFGGLPYLVIAIIGMVWIGRWSEAQLRRRALQAPLWMIVAFLIMPILLVLRVGPLDMALGVFVLGAICILVLGYVYVMIVFGLRDLAGDRIRV